MDFTGLYHVYYLSPAYLLIFLVLVGFIYHLIRNKEYKDSLLASIIIGIVMALILIPFSNLIFFFKMIFIYTSMVILGGFIAVGFKKVMSKNVMENSYEFPEIEPKDHKKVLYGQSRNVIIIFSSLLLIALLVCTVCLSTPAEDSVQLGINFDPSNGFKDANYTDNGEMIAFVTKNTTHCILTGSSESNATVTITSSDLAIYNKTIPLNAENKFSYKLDIPQNVSTIKVMLTATKTGEKSRSINFVIKKQ